MTEYYHGYAIQHKNGQFKIIGLPVLPFFSVEEAKSHIDDLLAGNNKTTPPQPGFKINPAAKNE